MVYNSEKVIPYNSSEPKTKQVERMFNSIASSYDNLNGILSLGIDNFWRKDAIKKLTPYRPRQILDVATGTGDFAILAQQILSPDKITGIDISEKMIEVGKKKIEAKGLENSITLKQQDCREMNFPNDTFDAVTVAFGVRNFENINASFREIHRVLKPDGIFLFLELSTPQHFPMKQLYTIYSKFFIPFIGRLISSDKNAYNYLPQSISAFPQGKEMMAILEKNNFYILQYKTYTAGVCSLYIAQKRA
ncbi:MAG: bifunctional demethylmenaquinone methyltransferase/2-methoxy-6-polyprenyl-1,4-benzoquinol methylase UbiE [Bacteroidales bacterium]|jgi:demethylmenaquinone methyltransferase/2-methoxy-6-polyprenyl-1,4-benzoquinol methylase|nr:bifunctional demethylmenaquinone methyltransferase/2-methoxy-6-polyprenyl-1,4-benzoquinol methylase UbiE [Bacteroidales bacterium]